MTTRLYRHTSVSGLIVSLLCHVTVVNYFPYVLKCNRERGDSQLGSLSNPFSNPDSNSAYVSFGLTVSPFCHLKTLTSPTSFTATLFKYILLREFQGYTTSGGDSGGIRLLAQHTPMIRVTIARLVKVHYVIS